MWALGCTLFSILFGETPFERAAGPQGSLTLAIAQGKYEPPAANPHPSEVMNLVRDALVVDVGTRKTVKQVSIFHTSRLLPQPA